MKNNFKKLLSGALALTIGATCCASAFAFTPFETESLKTSVANSKAYEIDSSVENAYHGALVWAKNSADEWVTCSFGDRGFHVFLNSNDENWPLEGRCEYYDDKQDSEFDAKLNEFAYNFADENETQRICGLDLNVTITQQGNYAKYTYKVHNPSNTNKTFSLATAGDVEVSDDDTADLVVINNGQGVKMINPDDNIMFILTAASATPASNVYVGRWSGGDYLTHLFDDSENDAVFNSGDSAFCMSWTNKTIKPNETLIFTSLLELNESTAPTIALNEINEEAKLCGKVNDANIGTVDVIYSIDNGEEQRIENLTPNGTESPFEIDLSTLECGSTHTIKAKAVDDNNLESEIATATVTIPHDIIETVAKEASCTEAGEIAITCSKCDHTDTKVIAIKEHTYDNGTIVAEATCSAEGSKEFTCTVCGHKKTEAIEKLAHTYGEGSIIKEATCTEKGEEEFTCTVCEFKETKEIPLAEHKYEINEDGEVVGTKCLVCGFELPTEPPTTEPPVTNEPTTEDSSNNENTTNPPNDNVDDNIPDTGSTAAGLVALGVLAAAVIGLVVCKSKKKDETAESKNENE